MGPTFTIWPGPTLGSTRPCSAPIYKTDYIANHYGHDVLRTPVRHCELNAIELIWAQLKS